MKLTRTGKIARLPHALRQELNHRLREGEQGKKVVAWLNEQPGVLLMVAAEFNEEASSPGILLFRSGGASGSASPS